MTKCHVLVVNAHLETIPIIPRNMAVTLHLANQVAPPPPSLPLLRSRSDRSGLCGTLKQMFEKVLLGEAVSNVCSGLDPNHTGVKYFF